jgi:glycogen operon protein
VELLPVHHFVSEIALLRRGLTNYWGYNSLGYFAPHAAYSSSGTRGEQVGEFKSMVRALHRAGIEVILDVVYNHTAEGDETGPTLAFRGLDNPAYYRLDDGDPACYVDYTGCGNTLDARQPHVLQLIMDSLRYWVTEMHVDGFRFDLASALARSMHDVDKLSAFFDIVQQDPVVSRVKLIAEPWDVGPGGYQVGEFPPLWAEWNGKYRDTVRDFWLHPGTDAGRAAFRDLGYRLTGSSDLYEGTGRGPSASVNFVTAHDGFTLADLVSYERKHNEANGEDNRDGTDDNRSSNAGVEGPTDDPAIRTVRGRRQRALLATLLLSSGVPMITAGDEMGRTQHGNNNAYCQDNEISWLDWEHADTELLSLVCRLIHLRNGSPVLRQRAFFEGHSDESGVKDIAWFRTDGTEMDESDWYEASPAALQVFLSGNAIRTRGPRGERVTDASYLIQLNAGDTDVAVTRPGKPYPRGYALALDTSGSLRGRGAPTAIPAQSVVLLQARA